MEKVTVIIFVYLLLLILIMGFALGVYLIAPFRASIVFGVAWILHSILMVWQVFDSFYEVNK